MPRLKKQSAAEAAVEELQNKPAEVTRAEAKHANNAMPAKKRGRPKGSKNKRKVGRSADFGRPGPGRLKSAALSGLGQINAVVERMVEQRTRELLRNALAALKQATTAVEKAL